MRKRKGDFLANHVNVNAIADLINDESFDMNWFSYHFAGGWGSRLTKYRKKGAAQGIFTPGISNEVSITKVYKKLQNNDFSDISGFYVAILCFFGEKVYENLDFVEKIPKNSINRVVSALECPIQYKSEIYEICHAKYDFIDFITAASKLEKVNFDLNSAISVYKLQGDAAIFRILCQMFYNNKGVDKLSICLINDLPVNLPVDVSDFVSGCYFPVAVSPVVSAFKWSENQNGWFLYGKWGENWRVVDVAGVGRVCLAHYSLSNRLNYLASGGEVLPYIICWNWGDIIDAYHYFGSDLLVRDLKNDIFTHYWFNFGLKSKLNVRWKDNLLAFSADNALKSDFNVELNNFLTNEINYLITDLQGNFVDFCEKRDVFFSDSEAGDWYEIGKLL